MIINRVTIITVIVLNATTSIFSQKENIMPHAMARTWDGKPYFLLNETSECKLQRARDVPSRIALFAPIALSNFVIGVDETSYLSQGTSKTSRTLPRKLPNRDHRLLLWISWRVHKNLIEWIYTSVDLTNNHAIELWYLVAWVIKTRFLRTGFALDADNTSYIPLYAAT